MENENNTINNSSDFHDHNNGFHRPNSPNNWFYDMLQPIGHALEGKEFYQEKLLKEQESIDKVIYKKC